MRNNNKKYHAGEICDESGIYLQFSSDEDDICAHKTHDIYIEADSKFPDPIENHHFRKDPRKISLLDELFCG